ASGGQYGKRRGDVGSAEDDGYEGRTRARARQSRIAACRRGEARVRETGQRDRDADDPNARRDGGGHAICGSLRTRLPPEGDQGAREGGDGQPGRDGYTDADGHAAIDD